MEIGEWLMLYLLFLVWSDTCLLQIRVSDLVGKSVGKLAVTADTARHLGDDAVVLSKKPFTISSADP